MKRRLILVIGSLFLVLSCTHAMAKDHILVPGQPLKEVMAVLKAGDTLKMQDGKYSDFAVFTSSGTEEAPITIEGSGDVLMDGSSLGKYRPVFRTNGQSYLHFKSLNFVHARAGVQIDPGSHHITIDDTRSDDCQFAVRIIDASFVKVRRAYAQGSRNAFRGEGKTHDVAFDDIEAYASKDIYEGYEHRYLNGDGFIFEEQTFNLSFRNIVSADHWDAGLDIKGSHVVIENIIVRGNKNNLKLWGKDIVVKNALIYGAKSQKDIAGKRVDGNGVNVRNGDTSLINVTVADNEHESVKTSEIGRLSIKDSVVACRTPDCSLLGPYGEFTQENVIWFKPTSSATTEKYGKYFEIWKDPGFVDWTNGDYCMKENAVGANCGMLDIKHD